MSVSQDDLNSLLDMFGPKSGALNEQLGNAQEQAYNEIFSPNAEMQSKLAPNLANKSAAESAEAFGGETRMASPSEIADVTGADKVMATPEELAELASKSEAAAPAESSGLMNALKGAYNKVFGAAPEIAEGAAETGLASSAGKALSSARRVVGDVMPLTLLAEAGYTPKESAPAYLDEDDKQKDYLLGKQHIDTSVPNIDDLLLPNSSKLDPIAEMLRGLDKSPEAPAEAPKALASGSGPSRPRVGGNGGGRPPSTPADPQDYMKQLLASLYGGGISDSALKEAQQHRNEMERSALAGRAGKEIAAALSRGAYKPDYGVQDEMMKMSANGIQDILTRRKGIMEGLETGIKASDLMDKQQLRDPGSAVSREAQRLADRLDPGASHDGMSVEALKQLLPGFDTLYKSDMLALLKKQQAETKKSQDSLKALPEMATKIAGYMRSGPNAVAGNGVLSADKIMDLFKGVDEQGRPQSDPNNWSGGKVQIYKDELGKLARGGVSHEGQQANLIPPTIANTWAKFASGLSNEPLSAGQGKFVMQFAPYVKDMRQTSSDYLKKNVYEPVTTAYSHRVDPSDMTMYKKSTPFYPELIEPVQGQPASLPQPNPNKSLKQALKTPEGKVKFIYTDGSSEVK